MLVLEPCRFEAKHAGGLNLRGHIGQFELNGLMIHNLGSKGLAFFGVFDAELHGATGNPQGLGGNANAAAG